MTSSCLSARLREQLGFCWTVLHEIWYLRIFFRKYVEKIQVALKWDKNKWYLYMEAYIHFLSYLAHFFLEWEMLQTKVVE